MSMRRKRQAFQPCFVYDAMGFVRVLHFAMLAAPDIVALVMRDVARDALYVRHIGVGQVGPVGSAVRYIVAQCDVEAELLKLKERGLRFGATPDAIRYINAALPLSEEEVRTMAEKLKGKGDAAALKEAAKTAPVGGKKAAAAPAKNERKGNPAALEKAREARAAGNAERDKKKIKVLNKNHGAREGSKRAEMLDIVLKAKTVGEALENGAGWIDVKFAADKEYISIG